ncbi:MAG: hypothetical protein AAGJ91_14560 [Pseudomonadota bacterium]
MARFVYLLNTVGPPRSIAEPPDGHLTSIVDQYDLDAVVLEGAQGVLLSQHLDERHLGEHAALLRGFLERGGAVVLNGPVARPYLDPPGAYTPLAATGARDWLLEIGAAHPIMTGVRAEELSYRRGVIGFWARGFFAPPEQAVVLTRFAASGHAADYVWTNAAGGRLFVHPGNDIWGYSGDGTTAAPIFARVLDWCAGALA